MTATEKVDIHLRDKQRNGVKPKGLAAKLVAAALAVENVAKRGTNTEQNYKFAQAEDVASAATKALLAHGVLAEFECEDAETQPIRSKRGSEGLIVTVRCRLIVTDSESGQTESRLAMGSGSDYPGDKAIYKAMTGARKYAFLHLLGIPIGDDPDAHRGEPRTPPRALSKLERKRVEAIVARFHDAKLNYADIAVALGAAGIDGLRANSKKAITERVSGLSGEQADALEAVLDG